MYISRNRPCFNVNIKPPTQINHKVRALLLIYLVFTKKSILLNPRSREI